mmetsp:Transcript_15339/g.20146  ORF Transcript_15339/g.20146 Transcript_15339/m.20146 type:complete len:284 (-) Transcript_15339:389-1240(-)
MAPKTGLPEPPEVWVHSCCTRAKLSLAVKNLSISAVEADVLIGNVFDSSTNGKHVLENVPIMAHPPSRESDLSFDEFFKTCCNEGKFHIKLDFKEFRAAEKCLPTVAKALPKLLAENRMVYLNADILPGPGVSPEKYNHIDADKFLSLCASVCPDAALSLGWKMQLPTSVPYSTYHIEAMISALNKHTIRGSSVVFAMNARCAHLDLDPIKLLLHKVPGSQLLLWTGHGEPATSSRLQNFLRNRLPSERTGFDIQISTSEIYGYLSDLMCYAYGYWLFYFPKS